MKVTISREEIEQRMANFKNVCRDADVKLTHQRREIFREVARVGDHPDAESVFKRVRKRIPSVSQDTVYRTLWLLKEMGLIHTLGTHYDRTRFDANLHRHHHFICTGCGMTMDFVSDAFNNLKIPESLNEIGEVEQLQVEVRGVCKECTVKKQNATQRRKMHERQG